MFLPLCDAFAQRENFIWYFANGAGLDFNFRPPKKLPLGPMNSAEGCATYSDPETGQLLVYTNGVDVWNRENEKMPNGNGLKGHRSSTQSALILRWPGKMDSIFIFTTDNEGYEDAPHDGLNYSLLDLSRDHGYGDIVRKNVRLRAQSSEKLTAISRCDEKGYYVIAHSLIRDTFFVLEVTVEGVHPPQIYRSGQQFIDQVQTCNSCGYLRASPSRDKLASVGTDLGLELFDFDPSTGRITLDTLFPRFRGGYGLSFSPSGRFLYLSFPTSIWQVDLENDYASTPIFATSDIAEQPYALALGPDSSIYVSMGISRWLGRITRPDSLGDSTNFNPHYIKFDWNTFVSLPNFVDSRPDWSHCAPPVAAFILNDSICEGECIEPVDRSQGDVVNTYWRISKNDNLLSSSSQKPVEFCLTTPGEYEVQLVAGNSGGSDTTYRTVYVKPNLDRSREVVLQLTNELAYPGDTITYSIASSALRDLPTGVYLSGALEYDSSLMMPVLPAIGESGRVRIQLSTEDTVKIRFVSHVGRVDSAAVRWREVHWQNACAMPVRTVDGSLRLRVRREGEVLVQEGKSTTITPFPNPSDGPVRLMIDLAREGAIELKVFDAAGRMVHRLAPTLVLGKNWVDLDLKHLAAGSYSIALQSATEYVSQNFVLLER